MFVGWTLLQEYSLLRILVLQQAQLDVAAGGNILAQLVHTAGQLMFVGWKLPQEKIFVGQLGSTAMFVGWKLPQEKIFVGQLGSTAGAIEVC